MKKLFTYLLILCVAVLASCKKDNNSTVVTPPTTIGAKVSPDGFNYSTTQSVSLNITLKAPDNTPIKGAIISISLPDSAITGSPIFKGATNSNGTVTGVVNVPSQYTQLIIYPNYAGLIYSATANIHGGAITATIGGTTPYSGDIVPSGKPIPSSNVTTYSGNFRTFGASATDFMYPSPYTNTASAVSSPISQGKPLYLDATNDAITNDFIAAVNNILPENGNLPTAHPEYFGSNVVNVINVTAITDIYINYLGSGTSSYNSLAWYSYPTNNPPTASTGGTNNGGIDKITLVYPNLQASGSGGGLVAGNRVKIGTFNAGTTIALCLVSQGWVSSTNNGTTTYGVNTSAPRFFSQDALNPETNSAVKKHCVMFYDVATSAFVYGLEDANRVDYPTNNDFNDGMVYIKSSVALIGNLASIR